MDLVLRGVVIGVSSVIALFAFLYILSWHEEEMRHTVRQDHHLLRQGKDCAVKRVLKKLESNDRRDDLLR